MRMLLAGWGYNIHRTTAGDSGLIRTLALSLVRITIGAPGE